MSIQEKVNRAPYWRIACISEEGTRGENFFSGVFFNFDVGICVGVLPVDAADGVANV